MKAYLVPLLIFSEQREEYLLALEAADGGRLSSLIDLFSRCTIASLELALESLSERPRRDAAQSIESIRDLYRTSAGLTHREVDLVAYRLAEEVESQLRAVVEERGLPQEVKSEVVLRHVGMTSENPDLRVPIDSGGRVLRIALNSARPAEAQVKSEFTLFVSRAPSEQSKIVLLFSGGDATFKNFEARIEAVHPTIQPATQARIRTWCVQLVEAKLERLAGLAKHSLKKAGY